MRMTLARFLAIIDAARECLAAYERLANAMTDLPQSDDVARDVLRILNDSSLRPSADAIILLGVEHELCTRRVDPVAQNREAVRRCRLRKKAGLPPARSTKPSSPETYTSEEYAAMVARNAAPSAGAKPSPDESFIIEKSEGHTIETKIERDATPTRGTDLSF